MQLYINPDKSPAAVQLRTTSQAISALRFKRGAIVPLQVCIVGSTNARNLRLGIKARNAYGGDLLLLSSSTAGTPTDEGTQFTLSLDVRSLPLHEALLIGSGNPLASLPCMGEFEWLEGDEVRLSDTITTTILNDIIAATGDVPPAVISEFPSPDRIATKDWVRGQAATADTQGLAKLGTGDVVPDFEAVPVGVTESGGLAVNGSSLSAYALACRHGFSGTEEEWLASLKGADGAPGEKGDTGEPGQSVTAEEVAELFCEDFTQSSGTGNDNANGYGFAIVTTNKGKLKSLSVQARISNSVSTTAPVWCKVWLVGDSTPTLVATSENSQIQSLGNYSLWVFPDNSADLPKGSLLRVTFYTEAHKEESAFGTNMAQVSFRCSPNTLANTGYLNAQGNIASTGVVPVFLLTQHGYGFASAAHATDSDLHFSSGEKSYMRRLAMNTAPPSGTGQLATTEDVSMHESNSSLHLSQEQQTILDDLKFGDVITKTGDLGVYNYTVTASFRGSAVGTATLTHSGIVLQPCLVGDPPTYNMAFPEKSGTIVVLTDAELAKLQALLNS